MTRARSMFLVVGLAAVAFAGPSRESKEHYDKGMVAYNTQDWPAAIRELRLAYQRDQRPEYLFALAQSQRLSGDCESAVFSYKAFLRNASSRQTTVVEGLVKTCVDELARVQEEKEKAEQRRARAAEEWARARAETEAPQPPPPLTLTSSASPTKPVRWYQDPLGDTLAVAAIAAVGVGTTFLVLGDVAMSRSSTATTYGAYQSAITAARPQQLIGLLVLGGGVLCGVGALSRYLTLGPAGAPAVSIAPLAGGAVLSIGGGF